MNKVVLKLKSQKNLAYIAHLQMKNYITKIVHLKFMKVQETIFFQYVKIAFSLMQEIMKKSKDIGIILLLKQLKSL
ncbi:MAG: hypothetical protein ACNI3H_14830 [Halarcobacter ebronensis]